MTTHELKRFRIDCDWQYVGCTNSVLIEDVANRYEARADAERQGWHTNLSDGCPHCVAFYAEVKARRVTET